MTFLSILSVVTSALQQLNDGDGGKCGDTFDLNR